MPRLIITDAAKRDIQAAYDWWKKRRSANQAERWYLSINAAFKTLVVFPDSCPFVSGLEERGVREKLFGVGRKSTHRILFALESDSVMILRIRHTSQAELALEDLA